MMCVDIKLWDIRCCFHYIINAPRSLGHCTVASVKNHLLMYYTELVATENESLHHNIEFSHEIKVYHYLKANKAGCIEP